jgi:hypothetical protein
LNLKIIYGASFLAVFLIVTGSVMYVNTIFKNIFTFDFTAVNQTEVVEAGVPIDENAQLSMKELKSYFDNELKSQILDSLKLLSPSGKTDTIVRSVLMDSTLIDSLTTLHKLLSAKTNSIKNIQPTVDIKPIVEPVNKKPDSSYTAWVIKTAGLYESMDSKKAAKIIQNYSDNVARDIIYIMKKKKAAEILSELKPDFAMRITNEK